MGDEDKAPKEGMRASSAFWEALVHAGSNIIDCACGRTHFVDESSGFDYEPGELERLKAESEKNPDRTILHADEMSVSWGYFDGKQLVRDCPCDLAAKYEEAIWRSRYAISEYLSLRAKQFNRMADDTTGLAKKVTDAVAEIKKADQA